MHPCNLVKNPSGRASVLLLIKGCRRAISAAVNTGRKAGAAGLIVSLAGIAASSALAQTQTPRSSEKEDEVVTLSPFVVSAEQDTGYQAASTVAGSRLATPLKETSAMIGIITRDLMDDLGLVDISEVGNWGANVYMTGEEDTTWTYQMLPNAVIRGIPGTFQSLARNYFVTYVNVFPYNSERVEIPRGPNAALYGDAPLGGLVNSNTKRARLDRNFTRVSLRGDSEGSVQATADTNIAVGRNLAFRINLLWENREGWRDADFQRNRAIHLASTWAIADNTSLRVEFEIGSAKRSLPPPVFFDQVSNWDGTTVYTERRTSNFGTSTGTTGLSNANDYLIFDSGNPDLGITNWRGFGRSTGTGFAIYAEEDFDQGVMRPELSRYPTIPNRKFSFNPSNMEWSTKDASIIAAYLEHTFFDKLAVEIAANYQTPIVKRTQGQFNTISVDVNAVRPDGTPNDRLGQLYADVEETRQEVRNWVNDSRILVAYPFEWGFMKQRLMGMYGYRSDTYKQTRAGLTRINGTNQLVRNANNIVRHRRYLEDGNGSYAYATDSNGFDVEWHPYRLQRELKTTKYSQIGLQGRYWDGKVATTLGWRRDDFSQDTTDMSPAEGSVVIGTEPNAIWRSDDPVRNSAPEPWRRYPSKIKNDSFTYGGVYFPVKWLGVFANYSEGFTVQGAGSTMDGSPWAPPTNSGVDFGLKLELFDGKVSGTISRYESQRSGVDGSLTSRANMLKEIWNIIEAGYVNEAQAAADLGNTALAAQLTAKSQEVGAIGDAISAGAFDTRDSKANGWELDLVINPTRNWRAMVNFSLADAFVSNAYSETKAHYNEYINFWRERAAAPDTDGNGINTRLATIETGFVNSADGLPLVNRAKYTARFFTSYRIPSGKFKGLNIGGGFTVDGPRVIAAYREWNGTAFVADPNDPLRVVEAEGFTLFNAMLSYEFKPWGKRVKAQLNINNLLDEDKMFYTSTATYTRVVNGVTQGYVVPNGVRYLTPRTFALTLSTEF